MLNAGTYVAMAKGGVLTESGVKKTPQVAVDFEIVSAEAAGERITWYGFLTDKTQERTLESLRYAGWRGNDIADLADLAREDVPSVELVLEEETYEGKTRTRVQWVNRIGGKLGATLPAEQAKVISARIRGALAAVDQRLKSEGIAPAQNKPPF